MVILHVAFKLVAVLLYLLTLHSFITTFILVTLLLSADFWVVKNICGRLLAGLRWWSIVDEEGEVGENIFQTARLIISLDPTYIISILSFSGSMSLGAARSELWRSRSLIISDLKCF